MSDMDTNYHEAVLEDGIVVVSEIDPDDVELSSDVLSRLPNKVARALSSWAEDTLPRTRNSRGLFNRDRYVTPGRIYEQMALASDALDDDVVGNFADTSEALAFQKVSFEVAEDKDQENIWKQIGHDLDLDGFVRQMWRELIVNSQCYPIRWWGHKEYKVKGKGDGGRERRKLFDIVVPVALGFLDPTRVVPIRVTPFGTADLAWIATDEEMDVYTGDGDINDQFIEALFLGKYEATEKEKADFTKEDIPVDNLMLLNPMYVWRHTMTKSTYERWSRIRMKSIFPLLDLKHQVREMDRAFLLGGINFIVLVTRGTDQIPAARQEISDTTAQIRAQSKSPVIVSDHRINIELITPDLTNILDKDNWSVLDERLLMRLWGTFQIPGETSNRETSLTLGRVIARGMASRRHMMKRSIEKHIVEAVTDHPLNEGFDADCSIEFAPRRMELEFDQSVVTMVQSLRDRGDISRETVLTEFNFDQELEASRREYEDERWEDVFTPTNVPFNSTDGASPDGSGRTGGRPPGKKDPEKKDDE